MKVNGLLIAMKKMYNDALASEKCMLSTFYEYIHANKIVFPKQIYWADMSFKEERGKCYKIYAFIYKEGVEEALESFKKAVKHRNDILISIDYIRPYNTTEGEFDDAINNLHYKKIWMIAKNSGECIFDNYKSYFVPNQE